MATVRREVIDTIENIMLDLAKKQEKTPCSNTVSSLKEYAELLEILRDKTPTECMLTIDGKQIARAFQENRD